ncbi:hypothetical protein [Tamlana flava]|uniref:hypothetical protein n=1 Tax=Tamlana flava TaxID=3158572 RepID=UPI00351B5BAF
MKNNVIKYLLLFVFAITACETDEYAAATNKDEDRVATQIDLSNPMVAQWYKDLNMGVLFEYDKNLDIAYVAGSDATASRWDDAEIPEISTLFEDSSTATLPDNIETYKQYKDSVVKLFDENIFKFFKANSFISGLMPYKIIVSHSIYFPGNLPGEAGSVVTESTSRYSDDNTGQLRTVYNDNAIVFSGDINDITSTEAKIVEFSKDNFYILFSRIMGMHNLYDLIPESFHANKNEYYGNEMEAIFRDEMNIADEKLVFVIDKDWFFAKGFIDSKNFYESGIGTIFQNYDEDGNYLGVAGRITHRDAIAPDDEFVADKETDIRSYLNEMIHGSSDEILAYPQNIQDNMKLLLDLFTEWGVDMLLVNPDLEVLNA